MCYIGNELEWNKIPVTCGNCKKAFENLGITTENKYKKATLKYHPNKRKDKSKVPFQFIGGCKDPITDKYEACEFSNFKQQ